MITFLAPGITCYVCSLLIKEPFTRLEKICTFVSFVGVIFIARPTSLIPSPTALPASGDSARSFNRNTTPKTTDTPGNASDYDSVTPTQRIEAVGIALVGVVGSVCAYTTIRWIGKRAHPLISVQYFSVWCTIVSTTMMLAIPSIGFLFPANFKEWVLLIFLGYVVSSIHDVS